MAGLPAVVLSDALPKKVCDGLINLFKYQVRGPEHFKDNFKLIDTEDGWPRSGAFGKAYKVSSITNEELIYVIKEVLVDQESCIRFPEMCQLLMTCQETVIHGSMNLHHENISKNHPELNWIVLPERLDAMEVLEVIDHGDKVPLQYLENFLGSMFYIVFDWYPDDLRNVLGDGANQGANASNALVAIPTFSETKTILLHILYGLFHLHSFGYVHNDLKPDNILLRHYREEFLQVQAVITDFGFSQSIETKETLSTRTRRHRYDPPDTRFSTKIDIWAFGVLCFQIVFVVTNGTRVAPSEFKLLDYYALLDDHNALRRFVRRMLVRCEDKYLVEVILQCLHKTPHMRPTARVLCPIFIANDDFKKACRVAVKFNKMVNPDNEFFEQMIFCHWFEHIFLAKLRFSGTFEQVTIVKLENILMEYDFPIVQVFEEFDLLMLGLFADSVRN